MDTPWADWFAGACACACTAAAADPVGEARGAGADTRRVCIGLLRATGVAIASPIMHGDPRGELVGMLSVKEDDDEEGPTIGAGDCTSSPPPEPLPLPGPL